MRGGGTSQAGQAIGSGMVVDTSKYLNRLLEVNVGGAVGARRARHRPRRAERGAQAARPALCAGHLDGQPRDRRRDDGQQLRRARDRCIYGKTIDHVIEQHVVLSDGSMVWFRPLDRGDARGDLRRATRSRPRAIARFATTARGTRPRSSGAIRRSCGASAATTSTRSSTQRRPFNLAKIMVGSEGTLGVVVEATAESRAAAQGQGRARDSVRRSARGPRRDAGHPRASAVGRRGDGRVHPRSHAAERGARAAAAARSSTAIRRRSSASSSTPIARRICRRGSKRSSAIWRRASLGYRYTRAIDAASQAAIWSLREAALGLSMAMKGDAKSLSFVEDTAVPPERLRDYIERFLANDSQRTAPRPASTRTRRSAACTCGRS